MRQIIGCDAKHELPLAKDRESNASKKRGRDATSPVKSAKFAQKIQKPFEH